MKHFLLVGNPNSGKSTLFNALTHAHAHTGNYCGVTAHETVSSFTQNGEKCTVSDLAGVYTLTALSAEEESAVNRIRHAETEIFLQVADVRTLPRALRLTAEIAALRPTVLVLTFSSLFYKHGGKLNVPELARRLGIPVYECDVTRKKDVTELQKKLADCHLSDPHPVSAVRTDDIFRPPLVNRGWIYKIVFHPKLCLPVFFALLVTTFYLAFGKNMPGTLLGDAIERFFHAFLPDLIGTKLQSEPIRSLLCDGIFGGMGSLFSFLPRLTILYGMLTFWEESGYLSALAFMTDGLFRKIGLSGRAIFSLLMGFGCTTAAILTTKGADDIKAQRRIVYALPYISCSAKMPVYLTVLSAGFANPFPVVCLLYLVGTLFSLGTVFLFRDKRDSSFLLEVPQISLPCGKIACKKLLFYLRQFIIKVCTTVFVVLVATWALTHFRTDFTYTSDSAQSILQKIGSCLLFLFRPMGIEDWQSVLALLGGFAAKENVAAILSMLYPGGLPYSPAQSLCFAVFVFLCPPCVSALAAERSEIGTGATVRHFIFSTLFAFAFTYTLRLLLYLF